MKEIQSVLKKVVTLTVRCVKTWSALHNSELQHNFILLVDFLELFTGAVALQLKTSYILDFQFNALIYLSAMTLLVQISGTSRP